MNDITYTCDMTCVTWLIHMCVTYMNECMSHVTHMNESCHTCRLTPATWHVWHDSFICVSHIWMSAWVMSHIWMSHVTHVDLHLRHDMCDMTHSYVCHIYEWVHESCHTYEWVMSHMSTYTCDMTHSYVWHAYMWHDSSIFVTRFTSVVWLIHVIWLIRVIRHIHMKDMTHIRDKAHTCLWHDSYACICVASHLSKTIRHMCDITDMCDMTASYVWHDSFMCVTWLIHVCDMIHICVI